MVIASSPQRKETAIATLPTRPRLRYHQLGAEQHHLESTLGMKVSRLIAVAVSATLLTCIGGCGTRYVVTANGDPSANAVMGEKVHVALAQKGFGCSDSGSSLIGPRDWLISPSTGATVKNGMFIATEPGTYRVTSAIPPKNTDYADPCVITVAGKRVYPSAQTVTEEEASVDQTKPVAKTDSPSKATTPTRPREPRPLTVNTEPARQAKPSAIELVFSVANNRRTQGGGMPARFTLKKSRHIRMIETYHFVYGEGEAPGGGYYTIETKDGTVLGPFVTTRVVDGRTGLRNAYWYADVDFILPAGTYTLHDSDPSTWSQNTRTGGVGFCGVSALRD